jgi:ELWxxDGT repeat protein
MGKVLHKSGQSTGRVFAPMMALEPRIMFDGAAMAEAVDAHSDGADAVMPVAVTANPRVLLLSSRVADGDDLTLAAKDDVLVVRYDAEADSLDAILSRLSHSLDGQQASSIALASHGANGAFELTAQYGVSLAGLAGDDALQAFMRGLGAQIAEGGRIDLLACGVAGDSAGNALLAYLSDITGRSVAASTDSTGNAAFGGDWHLEAGDVDASQYFHAELLTAFGGLLADPVAMTGSGLTGIDRLTNVNGTLYFTANDGTNGIELWKSDGTAAGTVMVKDIRTGVSNSTPNSLTNVNGTLYFRASDGTNGSELWKSDGTAAGTVMVKDIRTGGSSSTPNSLTNVNGTLYFRADDGTNGTELWKSDGTAAGTVMVKDIQTGAVGSSPTNLTDVNGTLYFTADDGTNGTELWKSDGTAAGTVMVKNINAGGNSSTGKLLNVNGTLYFSADDGTNGDELWKSDGTDAGTVMVKHIRTGGSSSPDRLTNVNGTLYFAADDGTNGNELWKSDGTEAGTVMVKNIWIGANSSSPEKLTNLNGTLYFTADDGTNGREFWKSDGTEAGTVMVKDIQTGAGSSSPDEPTNLNGTLYFEADDGTNGTELWKSDGTAAGTVMVKDIRSGAVGSSPTNLIVVNGALYFTASDESGTKLFKFSPPTTTTSTATTLFSPPPPPKTGESVSVKITAPITKTGSADTSLVTVVRAPAAGVSQGFQGDFQAARTQGTTRDGGFRVAVGTPSVNSVRDGALFVQKGIPAVLPEGRMVNFSIPVDAFGHSSTEAAITLAAKLTDGRPLPTWLSFDTVKGAFIGQAPEGYNGALSVVVVARDNAGNEVSSTFEIRVLGGSGVIQNNAPPASDGPPPQGEAQPPAEGQAPDQSGEASPDPTAPVIKLSDFGKGQTFAGKPTFQEELRMANRLSGARQAQLLAAARAVARNA